MEEAKEFKDERPFYVTYEAKKSRWILNIKDPQTDAVVEKKVFVNGMWKKYEAVR